VKGLLIWLALKLASQKNFQETYALCQALGARLPGRAPTPLFPYCAARFFSEQLENSGRVLYCAWNTSMDGTLARQLIEDLRALVEKEGYSRYQIAQALGIHRSRLTGWLKDGRIPNADHALAIAALLAREKRRARRARVKGTH
jgi:predicted XRE-type DNA-binding protein